MSIKPNNATVVSTCNQRITALTKLVAAKTPMKINRQQMKLSDVVGVYQACIDTRSELVSQRAAYNKALVDRNNAEVTRQAIDEGLKSWVANEFGVPSAEAEELGFLPPKIGAKSAATKAEAVEKLLATRKARLTMGKRQKEKIKGTIVAPTAPADPALTATAATPATTATNGVVASH
jgi:hypothetical protein